MRNNEIIKDEGVKFVLKNFNDALEIAKTKDIPDKKKCISKIAKEMKRLLNFTKTGNMYQHFIKFQDGNHPYNHLFDWMHDYNLIKNEDMASILFHKYRNEITNVEYWWDWKPGMIVSLSKICAFFGGSDTPGIQYISKYDTMLIRSSQHSKSKYIDTWKDGIFYYTWFNKETKPNQKKKVLSWYKNRVLKGTKLVLFERIKTDVYKYIGRVIMESKPIYSDNGETMVLPLKPINTIINYQDLKMILEEAEKDMIYYEADVVLNNALKASDRNAKKPSITQATVYDRSPDVSFYTKKRANGFCDLCGKQAPFLSITKLPYLEVHHVKQLADNGPDSIINTVALCPNCHREIHVLKDKSKIKQLILKIGEYLEKDPKLLKFYNQWKELFNI